MDLYSYFDRVVLLNLKRRPDRLAQAKRALQDSRWPFKTPEIFPAIDGKTSRPPTKWKKAAGVWGCAQSHLAVLEQAIRDQVESILILEDDVCFVENFHRKVKNFLQNVPQGWEGIMLGGQHIVDRVGWPARVKPGVVRCIDCERTHAYALRGKYLRDLCARWRQDEGDGLDHCDHIMGRDPRMQRAHKVYAPELFLAGQERSRSDVTGHYYPRRFWNPPGPDLKVIILRSPRRVLNALRAYGIHTGYEIDDKHGAELQLTEILARFEKDPALGQTLLRHWIIARQWEVCGDKNFVLVIAHPAATLTRVKSASLWPVIEISATTVAQAIRQMPVSLRPLKS